MFVAVIALVLASMLGAPATFAKHKSLKKAQALVDELRPAEALKRIDRLIDKGGLDWEDTRDAYAMKAEVLALVGETQEAVRAFSVLLRVDPDWAPPAEHATAMEEPLSAAKAQLPAAAEALSVTIRSRFAGGKRGLELALVHDDMALVWTGALYSGDTMFLDLPLNTNLPLGFIPVDEEAAKEVALTVRLLDPNGNTLRVIPVSVDVLQDTKGGASRDMGPLPWLTLSGAAIAAVSMVAMSASAIGFAAIPANAPGAAPGQAVLLTSTGVAALGAAVGAGLVITDLVLQQSAAAKSTAHDEGEDEGAGEGATATDADPSTGTDAE